MGSTSGFYCRRASLALAAFLTLTASASAGTTLLLGGGGEGYGMFVPLIQAGSAELSTIGVPGLDLAAAAVSRASAAAVAHALK
jgi:hypothetical protein